MRKLFVFVLAFAWALTAMGQQIRDIDIRVELQQDGSAWVTQVWDVTVVSGTEWYVPIENLGKMTVSDLSVSENGVPFRSEGDNWNVNWSREQKANRCGIHHPGSGKVELCWGQGEYGAHKWEARFHLTGLVQSLNDYDAIHFMFVNPGLVSPPQHVKLTLVNATGSAPWTLDNTRVWGFGFYGDIQVTDGAIVAESSEPFSYHSSLIALVRFQKGLFAPGVTKDSDFEEVLTKALEGSSYGEGDDWSWIMGLFAFLLFFVPICIGIWALIASALGYKWKKSLFGKTKITGWYRDVPLDGNLLAAYYVLEKGKRFTTRSSSQSLIGALFLRWILDGKVRKTPSASTCHFRTVPRSRMTWSRTSTRWPARPAERIFCWSRENSKSGPRKTSRK